MNDCFYRTKTGFVAAVLLSLLVAVHGARLAYKDATSKVLSTMNVRADTSGTCGENLTWSYDTNSKNLTINGTGKNEGLFFYFKHAMVFIL